MSAITTMRAALLVLVLACAATRPAGAGRALRDTSSSVEVDSNDNITHIHVDALADPTNGGAEASGETGATDVWMPLGKIADAGELSRHTGTGLSTGGTVTVGNPADPALVLGPLAQTGNLDGNTASAGSQAVDFGHVLTAASAAVHDNPILYDHATRNQQPDTATHGGTNIQASASGGLGNHLSATAGHPIDNPLVGALAMTSGLQLPAVELPKLP